jgi:hypothetical protein
MEMPAWEKGILSQNANTQIGILPPSYSKYLQDIMVPSLGIWLLKILSYFS